MNAYYSLTFNTDEGKKFTMRVPNAADSVNPAPIKNSMDRLIDSSCIKTQSGDLYSRESARLVSVSKKQINVK